MSQEQTPGFTIENPPVTEVQAEKSAESTVERTASTQAAQTTTQKPVVALPATHAAAPVAADPIQKEVEEVLTANIAEIYKQLAAEKKMEFKQRGEEIAQQISSMLRSGILQVKKILSLILDWLHIIPGVNKFFLEKEAKLKTDKIQQLFEREHAAAV